MARRPKISVQHVQTPVTLDNIAPLGRIGVLSLATDFNIEQDLRRIFPPGFQILTNRITNANPLTFANLRAMAGDVTRAAAGMPSSTAARPAPSRSATQGTTSWCTRPGRKFR